MTEAPTPVGPRVARAEGQPGGAAERAPDRLAQDQRLRVRAARLRVVLDRRLDRHTPAGVHALAAQPLARSGAPSAPAAARLP